MRLSPARRLERVSSAKVANRSDSGIAMAIAANTSTAAQWPNTRRDYSTGFERCDDVSRERLENRLDIGVSCVTKSPPCAALLMFRGLRYDMRSTGGNCPESRAGMEAG